MNSKEKYLKLIGSNIKKYGYHLYEIVDAGPLPRFFYTIGLLEKIGAELVFAGALLYSDEEVKNIIEDIIMKLTEKTDVNSIATSLGNFSLGKVDPTWSEKLMLGVFDYYNISEINAFQIIPKDSNYLTIDVPKLANKYDPKVEPVWKWLTEEWHYNIPKNSMCATDLDALHGKPIISAIRWEEEYWEIFSKPPLEISKENTRFVSLGIFLAIDSSNEIFAQLEINEGASRTDPAGKWEIWSIKE